MASKLKQIEKTQNCKNFDLKKNYSEKMQKALKKKILFYTIHKCLDRDC